MVAEASQFSGGRCRSVIVGNYMKLAKFRTVQNLTIDRSENILEISQMKTLDQECFIYGLI